MITLADYKASPYYKTTQTDDLISWLLPECWEVLKRYIGKDDIDLIVGTKNAACKLISHNLTRTDGTIKSESLGDYSVSFEDSENYPKSIFSGLPRFQGIK